MSSSEMGEGQGDAMLNMRMSLVVAVTVGLALWLGAPPGPRTTGPLASAWAQDDDDFGFDLSGDAKKKKKKKDDKKQPPKKPPKKPGAGGQGAKAGGDDLGLGLEGLDVSVKSAEKEAMEKALDQMKDEKYDTAAAAFWELYNNPKAKEYFQSTEYQLAKALYRMRMYHSALQAFGKILEKGVDHKYFKTSLEWLFFISHKITDQKEVLTYIARYSDIEFPKKYKDEFLFLLAKYFYFRALDVEKASAKPAAAPAKKPEPKKTAEDDFGFDLGGGDEGGGAKPAGGDDAFGLDLEVDKKAGPSALPTDAVGFLSKSRALILQVSEKSKFYARAKYLDGIIFYKEGNFQEAVNSFREVVRLLHPKKGKFRDDALRESSFFQLARVHYEHKQFRYALFYYERIKRDSFAWLEALFESSWAWFRIGKYQKSLGNLITLDSPFFREEYFPEGLVLKAVTYFENCRYPESNQIVAEFKERFAPLHKELEKLTSQDQAPETYYKKLLEIQKSLPRGEAGKMMRRILKVALADNDLKTLNSSVLEIEREVQLIRKKGADFTASKLAGRLLDQLNKHREELVKEAGLLTKQRLEKERDFLGSLITQALRIKLENDGAELEILKKAERGEIDLGPSLQPYEWTAATDDERLYWPYEGEYWRDELGTYEYTLTWGCRKQVE